MELESIFSSEIASLIREEIAAQVSVAYAQLQREERSKDWLTSEEAAALLGISEPALRARVKRGRIPVHYQGRRLYFRRSEIDGSLDGP